MNEPGRRPDDRDIEKLLLAADFSAESRVRDALRARLLAGAAPRPRLPVKLVLAGALAAAALLLLFPRLGMRREPAAWESAPLDREYPPLSASQGEALEDPEWRSYRNFGPQWRAIVKRERGES